MFVYMKMPKSVKKGVENCVPWGNASLHFDLLQYQTPVPELLIECACNYMGAKFCSFNESQILELSFSTVCNVIHDRFKS